MLSWTGATVGYIHEVPKPEDVKPQQNSYIHNRFTLLEKTALEGNNSVSGGYPSIIDIPSFIDYMIINELGSNADAYAYSTFFHKDRNGKLRAGPIWDLDLTYGNDLFFWGYDRSKPDVWQFSTGDNDGSRFWKDLSGDPLFRCYLSKRWNTLAAPGEPLNESSLYTFIDQTVSTISEALPREYYRWGITGNFQQSIDDIKSFISSRLVWMTANLGPYTDCSAVPAPPLVITKIMYHPVSTYEFPESEDLEFIEILNEGDLTIDMTGIYFGGTGFVFCFPAGSSLNPHSSIILSSNASAFRSRYGITPYGQFTRHLSDKSEDLVMMDAFGNIIDNVTYSDTSPWPDADGNGKYLSLSDATLDNSLAENWTASGEAIVSDHNIPAVPSLILYPNPVDGILTAMSGTEIRSISIYDISGRELMKIQVNGETCEIDLARLTKGIYFVRVVTLDKTFQEKIIKN